MTQSLSSAGGHREVAPALAPIQQRAQVTVEYTVHFTRDVLDPGNPLLAEVVRDPAGRRRPRVLTVLDEGVARAHPGLVGAVERYWARHAGTGEAVGTPVVVPGGERVKLEPGHVETVLEAIDRHGIDRHSYVVAIGGGAVLDMAGYAAAIAHRGVRLVRLPTTVLAQNDSGVGVKNSVNHFGKKNFLGTFAPPHAVINDLALLATLPREHWCGGISEAVKVALLQDELFFTWIEARAAVLASGDGPAMERLVHRCAELHVRHIGTSGDPFEAGSSRPLDFGHWSAHKLEQLSGHDLPHGQAVGVGIALDVVYSQLSGRLKQEACERVLRTLEAAGLPTWVPELDLEHAVTGRRLVLDGLHEFREHLGGRLTITLLEGVGSPVDVHEMDEQLLVTAIALLRRRAVAAGAVPV